MMAPDLPVIVPEWPAPSRVRALCSTRLGGVSEAPWDSLNLGDHVGDEPGRVRENRQRLADLAGLQPSSMGWLEQVHGVDVVSLPAAGVPRADASYTTDADQACVIMTADCLPVLLCDASGTRVGAAHGGWRSLQAGVLEKLVERMGGERRSLMAWLGPAIGPSHFEVGPEVRAAFVADDPAAEAAFFRSGARSGHFMADIYRLARLRLGSCGIHNVYGGDLCTVSDPSRFYSYRRDGRTGRMASLIWISGNA